MMHNDKRALLYGLSAVLLWSTVAVAFKLTLRYIDALDLVWWSALTSFLILGVWVVISGKIGKTKKYIKTSWRKSMVLGMINPFIYYITLFKAYEILPAQEAQAINYTWALVLAFLSVPLLGHKLTKYDILAGILGYLGVLVIATHGEISTLHFESLAGVGLALVSTIFWALYWIYYTKINTDTVVVLFVNFGFGIIAMVLFFLWQSSWPQMPSWGAAAGALYIGLFEMSITFSVWGNALKLASRTAIVSNLIFLSPIISLALIHYIVGEKIYNSTIVALLLILAGLTLQQRRNN